MMTACFLNFLQPVLQCVLLVDLTLAVGIVNRPYGPAMCMEMCQKYDVRFSFMKEYHCQYTSPKDSRTRGKLSMEGSFTCFVKQKTANSVSFWSVMTGLNMCNTGSYDKGVKPTKDPEVLQYNHSVTLHQACYDGDLCMVRYILMQKHVAINTRGRYGRTPVMVAAGKAHADIFYFLLSQDCDLSVVDKRNKTVLHEAALGGSVVIMRNLLVDQGFRLDSRGWRGWTAAMFAAMGGHKAVLELLVQKGCSLNLVSIKGQNILHVACKSGHVDIIKYILSKGLSIESRDYAGRTPVMMAVTYGHIEAVQYLVDKGCNVHVTDNNSNNILHVSCAYGQVNMVKYILFKHNIHCEICGHSGKTALMRAAEHGYLKLVVILHRKGCNLNAVDSKHDNILHLACISGNVDIVKYILGKQLQTLNIDSRGFGGRTPVMIAAEFGHTKLLKFLVKNGGSLKELDNNGNNALHIGCAYGKVDVVRYLRKIDIALAKQKNKSGQTPLQLLVSSEARM